MKNLLKALATTVILLVQMSCEKQVEKPVMDNASMQVGSFVLHPAIDSSGNIVYMGFTNGRAGASVPYVTGFSFPFGNDQIYTEANDKDGWYNAQGLIKGGFSATQYHLGEDWNGEGFNEQNYPAFAMAEGEVMYSANAGSCWGEVIILRHTLPGGSLIETLYGHLSKRSVYVGQIVQRRQQIGNIGGSGLTCSGVTMTPHIHVEARYSWCSSWGKPGSGYASSTSGWFPASSLVYANFPTVPITLSTPADGASISRSTSQLFSWQNYWLNNAESRIQIANANAGGASPVWSASGGFQSGLIYNQNIGKYNGVNLSFSMPGTYYWSVRSSNVSGNSSAYGQYNSYYTVPRKITILSY